MLKHLHSTGCTCKYVPDYVLENLARQGMDTARDSLVVSERTREAREEREPDIEAIIGREVELPGAGAFEAAGGLADRTVYDSQNTRDMRKTLVLPEGGPAVADEAVTDAYESAGKVRDYFAQLLNRDSIDNARMDLILNVHFGTDYMNAFWDGDEMTFGDGDGQIFVGFARSLDVVAHELAHGVTQFTANLVYRNQSGALNEHFSDAFGTAISQHVLGQTAHDADWLIGNEIMGPSLFGETLRSMKAPGTAYDNDLIGKDPQPAHMSDLYTGPGDNGGVHINSGIFNRVFYLVSMSIGTEKAIKIWYHALQNLWRNAQFNDAVEVIVNSSRVLTKNNVVPLGSTQTVRAAFRDVGLPA
jgi:Zn-dependent metalloprotease